MTRINASRNGVYINTCLPSDCPADRCDVLLANILAPPLQSLTEHFADLTKPDSSIVLSGVLTNRSSMISEHYQEWFDMDVPVVNDEWVRIAGWRHD